MRLWTIPLLALTLTAQTPSFEVASVRPASAVPPQTGLCINLKLSSESVLASGTYRLDRLVEDAYSAEVDGFNIPQSVHDSGSFAVSVRIPPNTSQAECIRMLQNLLAERFHMVTAFEPRTVERYYLQVAKSGLKLKPAAGPPADPDKSVQYDGTGNLRHYTFQSAPASRVYSTVLGAAILDARRRSLRFAGVVDETGLTGYYDGEFEYTLPSPDESPLRESLEAAVARQLGLSLELRRGPGRYLTVVSADRTPIEN